jgi:hypothetical protein
MKLPSPALKYQIFANPTTSETGLRSASLNVMTEHYGLVILLTANEVDQLQQNDPGEWDDRKSLRLGLCDASKVFWSAEGEVLSILIGLDDESWFASFVLPFTLLAEIRHELKGLSPWLAGRSLPKGYVGHVPEDYEGLADE